MCREDTCFAEQKRTNSEVIIKHHMPQHKPITQRRPCPLSYHTIEKGHRVGTDAKTHNRRMECQFSAGGYSQVPECAGVEKRRSRDLRLLLMGHCKRHDGSGDGLASAPHSWARMGSVTSQGPVALMSCVVMLDDGGSFCGSMLNE